jgi:hypothetical protein
MSKKTNWTMLFAITAALAGLSAAAVYYVRRLKAQGKDAEGMIDDMVAFCKTKASELEQLLLSEQDAPLQTQE